MPHAAIYRRRGAEPDEKKLLVTAIKRAMIEVLKVPEDNHPVRLNEYEADAFLIPEGCSDSFTLIEATLFAGRTPKTKKAFFQAVVKSMGELGVDAEDVRVVIYDVPRENWGLKGGQQASEIDLGFEVEI